MRIHLDYPKYKYNASLLNCLGVLALITLSIFIYSHSWDYPFVFDDESFVVLNESVHQIKPLEFYFSNSLMNSGGQEKNAGIYFRPLVGILYSVLWSLQNGNVFPFHFLQWMLHTLSSIYIFFIFLSFSRKEAAFFFAAIFLAHPLSSENVVYISDLADTLSLNMGLLSLFLFLKWEEQKKNVWHPLAAFGVFSFFLGLLAKESAILFLIPFCILTCGAFFFRYSKLWQNNTEPPLKKKSGALFWTRYFIFWGALSALIVGYSLLRIQYAGLQTMGHNLSPISLLPLSERILSIPKIIYFYLRSSFLPYPITLQGDWVVKEIDWENFFAPLMCVGLFFTTLFVFVFKTLRKIKGTLLKLGKSSTDLSFRNELNSKYYLLLSWMGLFLGGLALHLQIIPLGATTAIRWYATSFFALLGIILLWIDLTRKVHLGAERRSKLSLNLPFLSVLWKWSKPPLAILILCGLSTLSYQRAKEWQDGLTLYGVDVERQPDSYLSQNNLGVELFRHGRVAESAPHFQKSLEIYPTWPTAWNNLGATFQRSGNIQEAEKCYLKAVQGHYYLAFENYANVLFQQKKWADLKHFLLSDALLRFPQNEALHFFLKKIPE